MRRISHHSKGRRVFTTVGFVRPVTEGIAPELVPVVVGTCTKSERQTPRPATTLDVPPQFAVIHDPERNTWLELEQARQLLDPGPEQLEQLESQGWHEEEVASKYCDLLHVGRHLPLESAGRSEEHREHWSNDGPVQLAQSGWHVTQDPEELKVFIGQVVTHFPSEPSWLPTHVRQKVGDPVQVEQEASHAESD
ncbi:hypothetical protein C0992_007104 [Termitomyces sp. T32_za158]|nr:hypothetical protein C0992_007104 [Termitomyces sp. T32_za158]